MTQKNNNTPGEIARESAGQQPFVKRNIIFMIVSLIMIVVGFLLMTGSANGDVPGFNEDIFSFRRIVLGPGLAFLGFVAMAFAIVYSPKAKKN